MNLSSSELYDALHPTNAAAKAEISAAAAAAGRLSFSQLYDQLHDAGEAGAASIDGHVVTGGSDLLLAGRDSFLALGDRFPTLQDLWDSAHIDPLSTSAAAIAGDAAAVASALHDLGAGSSVPELGLFGRLSSKRLGDAPDVAPGLTSCVNATDFPSNIGLITAGACMPVLALARGPWAMLLKAPCLAFDAASLSLYSVEQICDSVHARLQRAADAKAILAMKPKGLGGSPAAPQPTPATPLPPRAQVSVANPVDGVATE